MSDGPEPVPVACSLDAASLDGVLEGSDATLAAAAGLGQREKQCCAFFDVGIELGPDARTLYLRVPPEAEEAMAHFVELLRS
jgi:hypothetical protein